MKLCYGDMWTRYEQADLFLVTANSTINGQHELAMGKGSAVQAINRFPQAKLKAGLGEVIAGNGVKEVRGEGRSALTICRPYYLLISPRWPQAKLGLFQTKEHFKDKADLFLISSACDELKKWVAHARVELKRDPLVVMPMPGTGYGKLQVSEVMVYVDKLPDCVEVWQHAHQQPVDLPEIKLPKDSPLLPLMEGDRAKYLTELCHLLEKPLTELQDACNNNGFEIGSVNDRSRLQSYFLLRAWYETGDMNNAWHAARNAVRELEVK